MDDKRFNEILKETNLIDSLSPREFEELIALLLARFGWKVELTPATRAGGVDIFATTKDPTGLDVTWVVECKNCKQENKIGVEVLRALHGAKEFLGVSNGILATTSSFTKDATEFASQLYDLKLVDRQMILEWLGRTESEPPSEPPTPPTTFHSAFISYSHKDQAFTDLLAARLKEKGIRIWYAPEDIKPGEKIHEEIFEAISVIDKLVVVLSETSINSVWVQSEIRRALKREKEEGRRILFPISLIPLNELKKWECFDADSGKDLAVELREYYIPSINDWTDPSEFDRFFSAILRGLKAEELSASALPASGSPSASGAGPVLSEELGLSGDAVDILKIMADTKKDLVMHRAGRKIIIQFTDNTGSIQDFDHRFIEEDLERLKTLDLIRMHQTARDTFVISVTRRGAEFASKLSLNQNLTRRRS
ncbi:MAG TPA: restriction endonuclease [Terrimicrobiaceae bacterium]